MKQITTFPYALHSTPTFNKQAYPVEIDGGKHANYWIVFSPVHYPHYVGHFKSQQAAQNRAEQINANRDQWIYVENLPNKTEIYDALNA